jgi:hypothetical protein
VDMLLWGPALDAELEHRRERLARLWGRPAWADLVAGSLARRRAARGAAVRPDTAGRGAGAVGVDRPRSLALR